MPPAVVEDSGCMCPRSVASSRPLTSDSDGVAFPSPTHRPIRCDALTADAKGSPRPCPERAANRPRMGSYPRPRPACPPGREQPQCRRERHSHDGCGGSVLPL